MIYYTLRGPSAHLEIHDDKIKLATMQMFGARRHSEWRLKELKHFQVSGTRFMPWGKVEWEDLEGRKGSLRFSTNLEMVKKIERYLQRTIILNRAA